MKNAYRNRIAEEVTNRLRGLKGGIPLEPINLEMVEEFYYFLRNKRLPEGMEVAPSHMPKLTDDQAATVIWFLQEHLRVIPDNYERCDNCGDLYDGHSSGHYSEKGVDDMHCFCGACEYLAPMDDDE